MNVLKVYDWAANAKSAMKDFAQDNFFMVESYNDVQGKVKLISGHTVWFKAIITLYDAERSCCGAIYSWVEFNNYIETDAKEFIQTRIRECRS